MSDTTLTQATFIPAKPPKAGILDFSGTLSQGDVASLESQTHAPGFVAKVVVLPKNFSPSDMDSFGVQLANQWHVRGDRMLMLVDLKAHKVRTYVGHDLENSGLTPSVMTRDVIAGHFVPHMKQNDLSGAIESALTAAQRNLKAVAHQPVAGGERYHTYQGSPSGNNAYPYSDHGSGGAGFIFPLFLGFLAVMGIGIYFVSAAMRKKQNAKLAEEFKQRVGPLYELADQIGSASEYLKTEEHGDLAKRIAEFFNKLTTLEKAVSEVETLEKRNKVFDVRNGYLKLLRWVGILNEEASLLKHDVFAVTGGVQTVPEITNKGEIEPAESQKDKQTITIPERFRDQMQYRRPDWTYQPAYYQPMDSGVSSLMMMGMMLNQFEMNRQLSDMNWRMSHQQDFDDRPQGGGGFDAGGFDSGWGDAGGGSSGFDSSGGDWGGGGGDFGGGDFGGGGGDW